MKYKRLFGAFLATALAVSMTTTAFAADTSSFGGTTADGTNDVATPIVSYQIPLTKITVDAFQQGDTTGSQIYSVGMDVINKGNTAIRASADISLKTLTGNGTPVTVAAAPADTRPETTTDKAKKLYLEAVPAADLVEGATPLTVAVTPMSANSYDRDTGSASESKVVVKATATGDDKDANLSFVLAPATFATGATTASSLGKRTLEDATQVLGGAGSFRFMGSVNSNAEWKAGDFEVAVVYDVRGITKDEYNNDVSYAADGLNVEAGGAAGGAIKVTGANVTGGKITSGGATTVVTFDIGSTGATGIATIVEKGTTTALPFTAATVSGTTMTTTLTTGGRGGSTVDGKTYTVTFKKTGDNAFAVTLDIVFA